MKRLLENWKSTKFSEKESQIMEAYLAIAYKEGVENVTLQKVAKEAKIAYATVHYYFGQSELTMIEKALIYVGIASEKYIEEMSSGFILKNKVNSIEAYIEAKFDWNEKFPSYASLWCYFIYQSSHDETYRKLSAEFFASSKQRVKMLLLLEMGKGTYKNLENLDELADKIYQIIMGAMVLAMSACPTPKDLRARKETTQKMIQEVIKSHRETI